MKRIFLLAALLVAVEAKAEVTASQLQNAGIPAAAADVIAGIGTGGTVQANNSFLKFDNAAGSATLNWAKADASDNIMINAGTGKVINLAIATTPIAAVRSDGAELQSTLFNIRRPEYVATPATALTPAEGSHDFRVNTIIAAAGPTNMAIALPASPRDGEVRWGFNNSANPVVVAALGTPVMNAGATRRTVWPTKTKMRCEYSTSAASWFCYPSAAVPTPIA